MGHYKLTERFTSRDGKMEVDPRLYGMTQHGLDVVGNKKSQLGGATQIFSRIDGGAAKNIYYFPRQGQGFVKEPKPESGWCIFDMTHDNAGYNPANGEIGWWNAKVDGADSEVAGNIGLPFSWHVSTFLVFAWSDEDANTGGDGDSGPDVPPTENGVLAITVTLTKDGVAETYKGVVTKQ